MQTYEQAGCDAVLADGIKDMDLIGQLRGTVNGPLFCNVIGGGKVPAGSRADLEAVGVQELPHDDTPLGAFAGSRDLAHCQALLEANLAKAARA